MIREKVSVKDFSQIAKQYNHYIWHFIQKKQNTTRLSFFSYFDEHSDSRRENLLKNFIDLLELPYFESYTEESIDFLIDCNIHATKLYKPVFDPAEYIYRRQFYTPILTVFNHYNLVSSTLSYCYCPEGLVKIIGDLDLKYVIELDSKLA